MGRSLAVAANEPMSEPAHTEDEARERPERVEREAPRDPLAPARGMLLAVALGGAFWLALALFLVFYIARS